MRWILLLTYGLLVAGFVFAFFRVSMRKRHPRALPFVAAACMFSLVVGANAYSFWWQDTQVNRGVQE